MIKAACKNPQNTVLCKILVAKYLLWVLDSGSDNDEAPALEDVEELAVDSKEKKSNVAALPVVEAEDEENKNAADLDSMMGGKDAVGRAFGQRFFSSSQAPEKEKKKRTRKDPDKTEKDKIKKKSRQERAAEEIQAIVAQPEPAADGHERTSSGRASKPPRRPGDDAEYSVHNGYM